MKSRIILLVLILTLVVCCARAETIREQIGAPETCEAVFRSNTGRTEISVNASVYVPSVESIATYAVIPRDFMADEAWNLASLTDPDKGWKRWEDESDLPPEELKSEQFGSGVQYEQTSLGLSLPEPYNAMITLVNQYLVGTWTRQPAWRKLTYTWYDPETNLFYYPELPFMKAESAGQSIQGQALSLQEATEAANAFMLQMAPGYELRLCAGTKGEKGKGVWEPQLAYAFGYTRSVGGVPVTYVCYPEVYTELNDAPMASNPGQELITLVIDGEKVVNFLWQDPYEIGNMIQPQTDLLPFEQILGIFGTIAPLSVQHTETAKGQNGMRISEIKLGYMPVLMKDNPNQWELRPVWDFCGTRILPGATYDSPCYSLMTIDAIDGTVIDRNYGY